MIEEALKDNKVTYGIDEEKISGIAAEKDTACCLRLRGGWFGQTARTAVWMIAFPGRKTWVLRKTPEETWITRVCGGSRAFWRGCDL